MRRKGPLRTQVSEGLPDSLPKRNNPKNFRAVFESARPNTHTHKTLRDRSRDMARPRFIRFIAEEHLPGATANRSYMAISYKK